MNPEIADPTLLRAHVARVETYLRTHPNTNQVRQAAANVAAEVAGDGSPLIAEARALPPVQSLVSPLGKSSPTARDERFDGAVEQFVGRCYRTIDEIEIFQKRLKANEDMHDDDIVNAVLAEAAKSDQAQWNPSLSWNLAIPELRIRDALEELEHDGAVTINNRIVRGDGYETWLFTVTAQGRRRARGTAKPRATVPPVQLTQHIRNSTIASAGVSYGSVEQHVTINPEVRDMLDALAQFETVIGDDVGTSATVMLVQGAAQELSTNGWGEKSGALLRAIPVTLGGMTALAANAKPAYELVRSLAATHGIVLPPLP